MVYVKDLQPGTLLLWDKEGWKPGGGRKAMVMVLWKTMKHDNDSDELLGVGFMSLETFEVWKSYPTHDDRFDSLSVF